MDKRRPGVRFGTAYPRIHCRRLHFFERHCPGLSQKRQRPSGTFPDGEFVRLRSSSFRATGHIGGVATSLLDSLRSQKLLAAFPKVHSREVCAEKVETRLGSVRAYYQRLLILRCDRSFCGGLYHRHGGQSWHGGCNRRAGPSGGG